MFGIGVEDLLAEVARRLVLVDGQSARGVDPDPVLDLDDLGTEVGEQPGRDRTHAHPAEVGDADARERATSLPDGPVDGVIDTLSH